MKIVITSDTHFPFKPVEDGDVLIHAGDLMMDGGPQEWKARVESLRAQPHKVKVYVPGNHDFHVDLYQGIALAEMRRAGIQVMGVTPDRAVGMLDDIKVLGLPWVTGLPGWAFAREEEWVYDYMKSIVKMHGYPDIIVSHAPMYGRMDIVNPNDPHFKFRHVGCLAYNRWFHDNDTRRPKYWISGHIHESYGQSEYEGTKFINACMCDRNYDQTNAPIVIEV